MKVALVLSDLRALNLILRNFLSHSKQEKDLIPGVKSYSGTYRKEGLILLFFISPISGHLLLALEKIFLFKRIDFVIHLGHCFAPPGRIDVQVGDSILVDSSSPRETELAIELDSGPKELALASAKEVGLNLKCGPCLSINSWDEVFHLKKNKLALCFDQLAYTYYSEAKRYNGRACCLYKVRGYNHLNLEDYSLMEEENAICGLVEFALEFSLRLLHAGN